MLTNRGGNWVGFSQVGSDQRVGPHCETQSKFNSFLE